MDKMAKRMRVASFVAAAAIAAAGSARAGELEARPAAPVPAAGSPGRVDAEHGSGWFSAGFLAGASLPRPATVGVLIKLFRVIGLGASYSFLPQELAGPLLAAASVKDTTVQASAYEAEARLFPFAGAFFVGASLGKQAASVSVREGRKLTTLDLDTRYVTPRLGWLGTWSSGFSLGFDMGVQLPLDNELHTNAEAGSSILDAATKVSHMPLPSLNLRLGWML